jgi:hypothetical protein
MKENYDSRQLRLCKPCLDLHLFWMLYFSRDVVPYHEIHVTMTPALYLKELEVTSSTAVEQCSAETEKYLARDSLIRLQQHRHTANDLRTVVQAYTVQLI